MVQTFDQTSDQRAWDALVGGAPGGHLLQSWAWGELKARFGWRARRLSLSLGAGGTQEAGAQVLFRALPAGLGSVAYVPKGPLVDFEDPARVQALLEAIRPLARRERAICLKVEPNVEDNEALAGRLRGLGFRFSPQQIQPRRSLVVDLAGEPDEILARMKQKTRYNVRLAGRKGVTVRAGAEGDWPAFYRLMEATGERDSFAIHSQAYYETAHRLFVPQGRGRLLLAEYEGVLLAGLVAFAFGDTAIYMYGASSNEHRNRMPAYLLQWQAMLWAREQGCRWYDLWGVPDEDGDSLEAGFKERHDGLWGVYRFKRGFGGRLVRMVGAWDLVYAPLRYRAYALAVGRQGQGQPA